MNTSPNLISTDLALSHAAARATLAPSIHNTQPWRFVVGPERLDIYADQERRVPVIDPSGRQLAISCGAAIFGARVGLAARGFEAVTTLLPDPGDPDLLASIVVVGSVSVPDADAVRFDRAADERHSNRRQFGPDPVPDDVIDRLAHSAEIEGAWLSPVRDLDDRVVLATLSQRADARQNADATYRAELRDWTTDDSTRTDGVPVWAVPHADGSAQDDIPIRDFEGQGSGGLPGDTHSRLTQTMIVLGTEADDLRSWLAAGQALGRILLELTSAGYVASILSQVVEQPDTRQQLRQELRFDRPVALVLRAGVAELTDATPRRPLRDVISEGAGPAGGSQAG